MTFPGVDITDVPASDPVGSRYGLTAWGSKFIREEFDIVCPSGQRCRARQLLVEDAISIGVLDSLDFFTPAIMESVDSEKKAKKTIEQDAFMAGLKDSEKRAKFFGTINKVISHNVLIPSVVLKDNGDLPEGTVFVDDIPFADKMHIFRSVFSSRGDVLQSFREGQEGDLASVEAEPSVPLQTE